MTGILFLIAGPSGAGKDTLMGAVRGELTAAGTHVFPRRIITRPAASGGEDHVAVDDQGFDAMRAQGRLAFEWSAHGYRYGIERGIFEDLADGRHVVINVSRSIVLRAREARTRTVFILVDAPAAVLRNRLTSRGREASDAIEARLERARSAPPAVTPDHVIRNDGDMEAGAEALRAILVSAGTG